MNDNFIKQALNWVTEADAFVIFAGAGIGVDSGLVQFRGKDGNWVRDLSIFNHKVNYQELMTHYAFDKHPHKAWAFSQYLINQFTKTRPHDGYRMLFELIKKKPYFIITSNIDGHFQKAGFDIDKIYECHGSLRYMQCMDILEREIFPIQPVTIDYMNFEALSPLPTCPNCGTVCRPNIYLLDDWFWVSNKYIEQQIRYNNWLKEHSNKRILAIEIGAGTTVNTIRKMTANLNDQKHRLIRINPNDNYFQSPYQLIIKKYALDALKLMYYEINI